MPGERFTLGDDQPGHVEFLPAGASLILAHTEVPPEHEGQGLGGRLVRGFLEHARAQGKTVIVTCPFALAYIDRHPELREHLA